MNIFIKKFYLFDKFRQKIRLKHDIIRPYLFQIIYYFLYTGGIMPRNSRKSLKSPFFHVITQGINKSYIFNNPQDIKLYIKILI